MPHKAAAVGHLPPITYIQVIRTRHAGHCRRCRDELICDVLLICGPFHTHEQRQDDELKLIYNSSVPIQDVALKTCRKRWVIERCGGRGSEIFVLMGWPDDDDICNHISVCLFVDVKMSASINVVVAWRPDAYPISDRIFEMVYILKGKKNFSCSRYGKPFPGDRL